MPRKKFQVFVSSTYSDLIEERQSSVEAILRAGHIPAGMELFSAGSESQLEIIKRWIEESDIYMLLLGGRYGSIDPESGLSYTEVEYQYAVSLEKPLFAIVMDDELLNKKGIKETENKFKYDQFKKIVLSKICRFFKTTTEIKLSILESILDIQSRFDLSGWIRSNDVPDVNGLLDEINLQRQKIKDLESRSLENSVLSDQSRIGEYSFEEISTALKSVKLRVPAALSNNGEEFDSDVLDMFIRYGNPISLGLNNLANADEATKFLVRKVVPPLLNFGLIEKTRITGRTNLTFDKYHTSALGNKFLSMYHMKATIK
jgi:hypothetical protein